MPNRTASAPTQTDALELAERVRGRLVDLALAENFVRGKDVADACEAVWRGSPEQGGLVSELWVEGAFSSALSEDTLPSLARDGLFHQGLQDCLHQSGAFPSDRKLYRHQAEALRIAADGDSGRPSLVVSAGTGSGKTEAFLFPILNELWQRPRQSPGMRCLMLYPMNALVADQVERVDRWLRENQAGLRVFHFTSETPNDDRERAKRGDPPSTAWRTRTRKEAREDPPDIVITNYSMLEYMLCRPADSKFFGSDLRAIVLDEAHLYTGSLAAEIALLLRRVRARCGVRPEQLLQIATSATLGGDDSDLKDFAAKLFSSGAGNTFLIRGKKAQPEFNDACASPETSPSAADLAPSAGIALQTLTPDGEFAACTPKEHEELRRAVRPLVAGTALEDAGKKFPDKLGPFLWDVLSRAPLMRRLAVELAELDGALPLKDLTRKLFGSDDETAQNAITALLRFGASARFKADNLPLVPHRLHLLTRAPNGLCVCLNSECPGPAARRVLGLGRLQPVADRCRYCRSSTLALHRCTVCALPALAGVLDIRALQLSLPPMGARSAHRYYLTARQQEEQPEWLLSRVVIDIESREQLGDDEEGVALFRPPCPVHADDCRDPQCARQECPCCGASWSASAADDGDNESGAERECAPLDGPHRLALSVVAETLLEGMPAFADKAGSRNWKPAEGRRLLCFSDSRREAARLGPQLMHAHETWVIRAAIAEAADKLDSLQTVQDIDYEIRDMQRRLNELRPDETQRRSRLERSVKEKKEERQQASSGTPFSDFARDVSKNPRIAQILDRDTSEGHKAEKWKQLIWKENCQMVQERAEALVAAELNRPLPTRVSLESVGLVETTYPELDRVPAPAAILGRLPAGLRQDLEEIWQPYLAALLDTLRFAGASGWSEKGGPHEKHKWEGDSPLLDRWAARDGSGWGAVRFVGSTDRQLRRWFTAKVLEKADCPKAKLHSLSADFLQGAFNALSRASAEGTLSWLAWENHQLDADTAQPAVKILFDKLAIRKPEKHFHCPDSLTVWPRTILGWAPLKGCRGNLKPIGDREVNELPRWQRARRELRNDVFRMGLWGEEHSAQLDARENRRLQDLFRNGVRNILSSTTTMELGIDIGGLNGVLLGNVPPGLANHQQRAGRAGRRADGSAVVATFARSRAFDQEVFSRFGDFLSAELRRPVVFLNRERFVRRHLHAVLLGEFFRQKGLQPSRVGAMDAYSTMGPFLGCTPPDRCTDNRKPAWTPQARMPLDRAFVDWCVQAKAEDELRSIVSSIAADTPLAGISGSMKWAEFLSQACRNFENAIEEWRQDFKGLRNAWLEVTEQSFPSGIQLRRVQANAIRYQIKLLCDTTVIEWLADRRFLPRYGFPINLQTLQVRRPKESGEGSRRDERYRLERSSLLALGEYVPGAEVLVGGKVAVSRGLLKYWTDKDVRQDRALGRQRYALKCQAGHVYWGDDDAAKCPECNSNAVRRELLLFPRYGYMTAAWEPLVRREKLEPVGEMEAYPTETFLTQESDGSENFAGLSGLSAKYCEESELLLRNAGAGRKGFAICTRCGFAMSEVVERRQGREKLPGKFENHARIYDARANRTCWKKNEPAPVWRNRVLAARERTDMILFVFPGGAPADVEAVYSLGRALVRAGAKLLEVNSRELEAYAKPASWEGFDLAIYDSTAAGAGHCLELFRRGKAWFEEAERVLAGSEEHRNLCERACLECILDFGGQFQTDKLNRKAALRLLESLRG